MKPLAAAGALGRRGGKHSGNIILASASPRRAQLLKNLIENFDVAQPALDETKLARKYARRPRRLVRELAKAKAHSVAMPDAGMVIGADTVVVKNRRVLGKPENAGAARAMLAALSGCMHKVYTGVAVARPAGTVCYAVCTRVRMKRLTAGQIEAYVRSGEGMDKAGGYGIQGSAADFVECIKGDYFNVVGLPLRRLSTWFC